MASESNSNNFYIDNNGISFLAAMGNCQFYPNDGPSAADVVATMSNSNSNEIDKENGGKNVANGNPHQGHMNIGNNNANMNTNSAMAGARIENESSTASTNGTGAGNNNCDGSNAVTSTTNKRNANTDDQQQQQQQQANRWTDTSQMTHSHANGNAGTNAHTHNDDRIQNAYGQISSIAPTPPPAQHSNALWSAFHGSRNPWHFNGIPGYYQRLYSDNSNVADAQTHHPYHHHHHHLQHIDHNVMKSASTYAQSSYQGLFYCIPTCLLEKKLY